MNSQSCVVELPEGESIRVDRYISEYWGLLSRSQFKQRELSVKVNGKDVKLSRKVSAGDRLEIEYAPEQPPSVLPEEVPFDVIFENDDVLVINKPQGMVVHPAAGNYTATLVQGLMFRYQNFEEAFEESPADEDGFCEPEGPPETAASNLRPGIVHRLDKDTSGVIITAKNLRAQEFLSAQFRDKTARKQYLAVVKGPLFPWEGRIKNYLIRDPGNRKKFTWNYEKRGRHSCTDYRVLKQTDELSVVLLQPVTGRTHQLRVHMLSLGHPILGDPLYSRKDNRWDCSLMLHALSLNILLPGEELPRTFRAPLPERFRQLLREMGKTKNDKRKKGNP